MIEWVLVRVDLSPLMLLAIGLVVHGVVRRWLERRRREPVRPWWRNPVGVVPITVGIVMIVGHGAVERAFGALVSIAASLFLPNR